MNPLETRLRRFLEPLGLDVEIRAVRTNDDPHQPPKAFKALLSCRRGNCIELTSVKFDPDTPEDLAFEKVMLSAVRFIEHVDELEAGYEAYKKENSHE